jgi:hypothetical protein
MCLALDCETLRGGRLNVCPVYYGCRDALFPDGDELNGAAALALFWLAREVGRVEASVRLSYARDLAELFTLARRSARLSSGEIH